MGREPRHYSIWATIIQGGRGKYTVAVSAVANDQLGQAERQSEAAVADSLDAAKAMRLDMVRAMAQRLEAGGNSISNISLDLDAPPEDPPSA